MFIQQRNLKIICDRGLAKRNFFNFPLFRSGSSLQPLPNPQCGIALPRRTVCGRQRVLQVPPQCHPQRRYSFYFCRLDPTFAQISTANVLFLPFSPMNYNVICCTVTVYLAVLLLKCPFPNPFTEPPLQNSKHLNCWFNPLFLLRSQQHHRHYCVHISQLRRPQSERQQEELLLRLVLLFRSSVLRAG